MSIQIDINRLMGELEILQRFPTLQRRQSLAWYSQIPICRNGVSHRPDEYASVESIEAGTRVLACALAELAQ